MASRAGPPLCDRSCAVPWSQDGELAEGEKKGREKKDKEKEKKKRNKEGREFTQTVNDAISLDPTWSKISCLTRLYTDCKRQVLAPLAPALEHQ